MFILDPRALCLKSENYTEQGDAVSDKWDKISIQWSPENNGIVRQHF